MTQIPVDQAPAGPELDAAVEVAKGFPGCFSDYVIINDERQDVQTWIPDGFTSEEPPGGYYAGRMPSPYSTDIKAAWELAEIERMLVVPLKGDYTGWLALAQSEYDAYETVAGTISLDYYETHLGDGSIADYRPAYVRAWAHFQSYPLLEAA